MRVVLVTSLLRDGGAERVVATLATGLAARGHEVHVLVLRDLNGTEYPVGQRVQVVPLGLIDEKNPWWKPAAVVRICSLRNVLRSAAPDLVIAFQDKLNAAVVLATLGLGLPIVCTEHTVPSKQRLGIFWTRLQRWAYRRATVVVAPTGAIAKELRVQGARVETLAYPGATKQGSDHVPTSATRGCSIRAAGRLSFVKGFDRLLEAFALLANDLPEWTLEIAGEGEARAELEAQAGRLGLRERIVLRGRVSDVVSFFREGRVAVIASRSEAFPMVLLEAWSAGTPVVAVPSAESLQEMGGDAVAWAVDESPKELASVIRRVATDDALANALTGRGEGRSRQFSPERILDEWNTRLKTWIGLSHS